MAAERSPRASVIVLGFNGREYLRDCFASLLDQEMPADEYEILYVDNGSSDGSLDLVRTEFPDVRTVAIHPNVGFAEGNNVGYRHCRGQHIIFLSVDTVVHRRWLLELVRAADSSPDIAACHSNMIMPWYPEFEAKERNKPIEAFYVTELSKFGFVTYRRHAFVKEPVDTLFLAGACVLVKRQVLDEWGYAFEPKFFTYCEDTDLALRLRASGYRNVVVPSSVMYHLHTLATSPTWGTFRKTLHIIKNRYLAYYRNMNLLEMIAFAPLLLLGSCLKSREFGLPGQMRLLYGLAILPLSALAAVIALFQLPNHWRERRRILSRRNHGHFWLLNKLLSR